MDSSGNAIGPVGKFANTALLIQPQMQSALNAWATTSAASSGASVSPGVLTGALTAQIYALTGAQAGMNKITLTGPSYAVTFYSSGSKYGISYTCSTKVTLTNLAVNGVYNPISGAVDTAQTTVTFTSGSNASCSTSLDWIPVVGDAAARYVGGLANGATLSTLNAVSGSTVQQLLPNATPSLGFNAAVASGVFMFNGQDMGAYIKNNFATLYQQPLRSITLTTGAPQVEGPYVYGVSLNVPSSYENTPFKISFADLSSQLIFAIASHRSYDYMWKCPRGVIRCIEP